MLPVEFVERMKEMLGEEAEDFFRCLRQKPYQALRLNPGKTTIDDFLGKAPFSLSPVPWAEGGFYYEEEDQPGKHPFHEAGCYYIQEPSAMAPAGLLNVRPGERVLDLCAAPGGKSTQLAAAMKGEGILVCNEIHPARARILSENIERMGVRNALVTNETPQRLAEEFPAYFDKILVDAPCSGEGMFRKNEDARGEWSPENVQMCAKRQDEILDFAAKMLREGGRMVYSTCTFSPAENEGSIARFLLRHSEFEVVAPGDMSAFWERGKKEWAADADGKPLDTVREGVEASIRLWPHRLKGEGHFMAALQKAGGEEPEGDTHAHGCSKGGIQRGISPKDCGDFFLFEKETFCRPLESVTGEGIFLKFGEQLYHCPLGMPSLKGLKVLRPGLHLGTLKKNRFEPSHALALAVAPDMVKQVRDLDPKGKEVKDYLNGLTFPAEGTKGWCLITTDGYSLGWGKLAGGTMKNHYPKGLRK